MPNIIEINLDGLPRTVAQFVRYLADQSQSSLLKAGNQIGYPTNDAARMLGIPRATLNLWCRQGKVKAWQPGPRKQWRVDVEDVREFMLRNSV